MKPWRSSELCLRVWGSSLSSQTATTLWCCTSSVDTWMGAFCTASPLPSTFPHVCGWDFPHNCFFWGVFLLLFLSSSFFGFSLVSFGQASRSFQFTFLGWDFLRCYFYVLFVCLFVPLQCFPSFGLDNLGQASGSFELMCFGLSLVLFLASFEKHNWYWSFDIVKSVYAVASLLCLMHWE